MSELVQATLISGSIFAVVMATQYGRREFTAASLRRPVLMVAVFGLLYLLGAPAAGPDLAAYGVAIALGLLFGAGAIRATRVERDRAGAVFTRCGPAFAAIWLSATLLRLGFIWALENVAAVHDHVGSFMLAHQVSPAAIAPFFVLWALTMVISRTVVVASRVRALRAGAGAPALSGTNV